MNLNSIFRLVNLYCIIASTEKLPENSNNLLTVLKNIEKLETFQARKKYAEKNLDHLSSGSSRIVYKSPIKTIIKMAKNEKGISQNKAESNPKMKSDFLNKILGHAKNYSWIETKYLDKINEEDFKKMTGIDFSDFGDAIKYGLREMSSSSKKKPKKFEEIKDSIIYKEMKRIGEKFKLMPGDIARISSWGSRDKKPVLIDAGLTRDIFEKFYED